MQIIFRILLVLLFIGVPHGTHAAKKDLTDNVTYNNPEKSFGAADDNDTELYDILTGNEPTLGPLIIGGTGDSWLELLNNTSLVDDITGKYGIRFSNGVLQQIINGTPSSIGSGGGATITEVADTPLGWEMTPGDLYIAQDDGELSYLLTDSSEVFRYASTASTALFDITLTVAETDGSTVDINGTSYSNGGPYTISALTGSTAMDISYVTADTTDWTGADSGDVTGTTPNFFIDMTSADKTLIATIGSGAGGSAGQITHDVTHYFSNTNTRMSGATGVGGSARYAHIYFTEGNDRTICLSLKEADGSNLATGSGTAPTTAGWLNVDCGAFTIVESTQYYTAMSPSASCTVGATAGTTKAQVGVACTNTDAIPGGNIDSDDLAIIFDNNPGDPE